MFVFDGILQMANTQDQLAVILGHEMAHAVLGHGVGNRVAFRHLNLSLRGTI